MCTLKPIGKPLLTKEEDLEGSRAEQDTGSSSTKKKVQECFSEMQELLSTRPCKATLAALAGLATGACFSVITYPENTAICSFLGSIVGLLVAGACFVQSDDSLIPYTHDFSSDPRH